MVSEPMSQTETNCSIFVDGDGIEPDDQMWPDQVEGMVNKVVMVGGEEDPAAEDGSAQGEAADLEAVDEASHSVAGRHLQQLNHTGRAAGQLLQAINKKM